jgi:hypothetical protein
VLPSRPNRWLLGARLANDFCERTRDRSGERPTDREVVQAAIGTPRNQDGCLKLAIGARELHETSSFRRRRQAGAVSLPTFPSWVGVSVCTTLVYCSTNHSVFGLWDFIALVSAVMCWFLSGDPTSRGNVAPVV